MGDTGIDHGGASGRSGAAGRTGVWLVGARGSVATTAVAGAAAVRAGITAATGLVSELPEFHDCRLPALGELAFGGHDLVEGSLTKRAEALAEGGVLPAGLPELVGRALAVTSWSGTNLLGGGDGANLADAATAVSKTASKQRTLAGVLGEAVDGEVHIDYLPDLGQWKIAWDHVRFRGFLGVAMTMQFTWQGCDSALAAPLVLDLARFTARAQQAGLAGPLAALGFFFKDPVGTDEHRLAAQFDQLRRWAAGLPEPSAGSAAGGGA